MHSTLLRLLAVCLLPLSGALVAAELSIEHVTIVSPERGGVLRDASVRIKDGRIAGIATSKRPHQTRVDAVIDGKGLYLAPGLIDSHVHLSAIPGMTSEQEAQHPDIAQAAREQIPRSYLLYGFTTLIDLISAPQVMQPWSHQPLVSDTYFCGGAALMDGYSMNFEPKPQRYEHWPYMLIEPGAGAPAGIDPAAHTPQAVVNRMQADGAICVKTFFERGFSGDRDLPVPRLETIRELVQAAHAAGMPVLMHANTDEAHEFALDAGVDIVAHGLWNWNKYRGEAGADGLTKGVRQILDRELRAQLGWQPTRQVLYGIRDVYSASFLSDPRLRRVLPSSLLDWYRSPQGQWFRAILAEDVDMPPEGDAQALEHVMDERIGPTIEQSRLTTAYVAAHGGRVLFGTDTPSAPTYANPPGLNAALEMQRLMDSGETPAQIFRSATLENARAFKLDRDIGTVAVGKRANLLLLSQDPTQTIDAYAGIVKVILGGRVIDPSDLVADRAH
jgi:imidazolonepropionase-like amidohydrolase